MSRINNALKKDIAAPNLKVVQSIDETFDETLDDAEFSPTDFPEEKGGTRLILGIGGAVLLAVVFFAVFRGSPKPYAGHRAVVHATTQTPASVKEILSYQDQLFAGMQAFKSGNYETALLDFQAAATAHKNDPLLLVDIGMTYKMKHDLKSARSSYQAALQADPKYSAAYNNLAMISVEEHDWVTATGLLRKAIEVDPDQLAAVLNMAKLYERSGQWSAAEQYYSKYLSSPKGEPSVKDLIRKRMKKLSNGGKNESTDFS